MARCWSRAVSLRLICHCRSLKAVGRSSCSGKRMRCRATASWLPRSISMMVTAHTGCVWCGISEMQRVWAAGSCSAGGRGCVSRSGRSRAPVAGRDDGAFEVRIPRIALLLIAVASVVVVTVLSSLRSLRVVSHQASMLSLYRLDERLHAKNLPRELVPLVQAVNASLDRLEADYRVQR